MSLFERFGTRNEYILTSVAKAKEVRMFAERVITLGIKARKEMDEAAKIAGVASAGELKKQHAEGKKKFKDFPPEVRKHVDKSLHFRRLIIERLGSCAIPRDRSHDFKDLPARHERAIATLIDSIAPRFIKRTQDNPKAQGGYTRVLKTAQWVKGDGSTKALWGFVAGEGGAAEAAPVSAKAEAVGAK